MTAPFSVTFADPMENWRSNRGVRDLCASLPACAAVLPESGGLRGGHRDLRCSLGVCVMLQIMLQHTLEQGRVLDVALLL